MHKKTIRNSVLMLLVVMLALAAPLAYTAQPVYGASKAVSVVLDGKSVTFTEDSGHPFIDVASRTQVPLRATMEAYGCHVDWNNEERIAIVEKDGITVEVPIGHSYVLVNNVKKVNDTMAVIKDSRTFLPIRIVLEAFGARVDWDGKGRKVLAFSGEGPKQIIPDKSITEIARNVESVVMLEVVGYDDYKTGSGVILNANGEIATNYHVIEGAISINVIFDDGEEYSGNVTIQDYDIENDLAIIKIDKRGLKAVRKGDSEKLELGNSIVAIGSPYGYFNTVSEGIISSIRGDLIQISAAISHGSSGGGLFNMRGELVGITSSGVIEAENLGFAIPIELLKLVGEKRELNLETFAQETGYLVSTALRPPEDIWIVSETEEDVHINWEAVPGVDYYHFYYQTEGEDTFWYDSDHGVKKKFYYNWDSSVRFFNLVNGENYNIIVTSVRDGVESSDSEIFSFTKFYVDGFYYDGLNVPDFGKYANVDPVREDYGFYAYDVKDFDWADLYDYYVLLNEHGYNYYDGYLSYEGHTIMVYANHQEDTFVQIGLGSLGGIKDYLIITVDKY